MKFHESFDLFLNLKNIKNCIMFTNSLCLINSLVQAAPVSYRNQSLNTEILDQIKETIEEKSQGLLQFNNTNDPLEFRSKIDKDKNNFVTLLTQLDNVRSVFI